MYLGIVTLLLTAYNLYALGRRSVVHLRALPQIICWAKCDKMYTCHTIIRMQSDKKTRVDVRGFIQHFGGPLAMRQLWERHGLRLTKGTQDKWVMRGVVPTSRILEAVQVSRAKRIKFDFRDFIKTVKGMKA